MKSIELIDKKLLFTIFATIVFGLIAVLSASYPKYEFSRFYMQLLYVVIGFIFSAPILFKNKFINIEFIKNYSTTFYILTLVLLAFVFIPIDGNTVNGSTRWINLQELIGIPFKFQPSELAKLTIIIAMARMITNQNIRSHLGTIKTLIITIPFAFLLLLETDFGATAMITITALAMVFAAGTKKTAFFIAVIILVILLFILIYLTDNRFDRILAFVWGDGKMDEQRQQALIGIVRGGLFGVGIGASLQKIGKLPESHNDMIFAIIGEETGIFGMLLLLSMFAYIYYKGFKISRIAIIKGKRFQSYLALGISVILSTQTLLNLSVSLSLFPPKGITLPLISYGGSSLLITIIMLVILLKIDIENKQKR